MTIQEATRRRRTGRAGTHSKTKTAVETAFAVRTRSLDLSKPKALLAAADRALVRLQAREHEDPETWARRLAPTFFADLDYDPPKQKGKTMSKSSSKGSGTANTTQGSSGNPGSSSGPAPDNKVQATVKPVPAHIGKDSSA